MTNLKSLQEHSSIATKQQQKKEGISKMINLFLLTYEND